jgi:hypothetical protein
MSDNLSERPGPALNPPTLPPTRYHLERGWKKQRLIRELAMMEKTGVQLAKEYGSAPSSISEFRQRHKAEIDAVKRDIENEFAGLWIARKLDRIAEYQQIADDLAQQLEAPREDDEAGANQLGVIRALQNTLRAVAEEMGQLPTKVGLAVDPVTINYVVDGVDMSKLQ